MLFGLCGVKQLIKYKHLSVFLSSSHSSSSKPCASSIFCYLVSLYFFFLLLVLLYSKVLYYILLVLIKLTYVVCPRIARICMVAAQTMCFSHRWVLNFLAVTLCWPSFLDLSVSAYHRPAGISIVHGFLFLPGLTNAQISHRKSNNLSNVQIEFQKSSNDFYQNPFNCSSVGDGYGKAAEF